MEAAIGISAVRWAVGRALAPITSGLLEPWAASSALGTKIHELKMELLYAQGMLDNARGRDVRSPALAQLLLELRQLAYVADDVLDELEYFRIQDELNGTYKTMDPEGLKGVLVHAQDTVKTYARKLKPPSFSWPAACHGDKEQEAGKQRCLSGAYWRCRTNAEDAEGGCVPKVIASSVRVVGKRLPCSSPPSTQDVETDTSSDILGYNRPRKGGRPFSCSMPFKAQQKKHIKQSPTLMFDRVGMSKKMSDIVEQLKPICAKVSTILNLKLLGFNRTTTPETPFVRPRTTSQIIEPEIYGRKTDINRIMHDITDGKYSSKDLTVLPIYGVGGIGKTTFAQHIYNQVKTLFHVRIWICVSQNFNANRLAQEIKKQIPGGSDEKVTAEEIIEKAVQSGKFLLVLDDMWRCPEDEWKKLLSPFRKGGEKGNMVIVTTRFLGVAKAVESMDCSIKLKQLEPNECMALFESCVFGDQQPWKDHDGLRKTGEEIVKMLRGSPLAVKTVGRLLRTRRNIDHWSSILESKEWELQTSDEDVMPALNLSYNYLPFPVQQCFSYCGIFPEDYEFDSEHLIHLWIGLGLLCPSDQNKKIEYIGQSYLEILVDHGFFEKVEICVYDKYSERELVHTRYVIHDLLHELAVKVSSYECISINSSNVRDIKIHASVRHLSIIVDSTVVTDKTTFRNFRSDLATLGKTLKAENLHTLMLFGMHHGRFVDTLCDLFKKAKALRVISLFEASYNVEDLLQNFSNLVHVRYLGLRNANYSRTSFPKNISRLYHLTVLDVERCFDTSSFPLDMSNLVKLRHYIGQGDRYRNFLPHISMVGKLKVLQELRTFKVRSETNGFELKQLGQLLELSGSLGIYNLEMVQSIEEVEEAKLAQKKHLHKLTLAWGNKIYNGPRPEDVLENLKPHRNLRAVCISGNRGATCPSWLDADLNLEELELVDVYWNELPLLGKLCMVQQHGRECRGCVTSQGFQNLKTLELVRLPRLKKWSGDSTCRLLSNLEKLVVRECSELIELPFSRSTCHEPGQMENMAWFPKLREIEIKHCPNLLPLPPIPWTRSLCNVKIVQVGSDFHELSYSNGVSLSILGKGARDSTFWNVLAFDHLNRLETLKIQSCTPLPLQCLQILKYLKQLKVTNTSNVLLPTERLSNVQYRFPVKVLTIRGCGASGKELTQMLSHFPYLSKLSLKYCSRVSALGVAAEEQPEMATPASTSANKMDEAEIRPQQRRRGLVLLPPNIQRLRISHCPQLSHLSSSTGKGMSAGGGLQDLRSLQSFDIVSCPMLLSSNVTFYFLFPTSLQTLYLNETLKSLTLPPLPNLTSLSIHNARDLRGEDLLPLLSKGQLADLKTSCAPKFFVGLKPARLYRIQTVRTDDIEGFFVMPICRKLSSSLTSLFLEGNSNVKRFTNDQEKALHVLTSLHVLEFHSYHNLQSGPEGLSKLPSLKRLKFCDCLALEFLPKDSIPSSLEKLTIGLCPHLRSLPKDGIQKSSLLELVVYELNWQLTKQCRELKGTIPMFRETPDFDSQNPGCPGEQLFRITGGTVPYYLTF